MHDDLDIKSLVADLRVVRVRYELPDTAAFVRYQPAYDEDRAGGMDRTGLANRGWQVEM
jgi:hypothetical protein